MSQNSNKISSLEEIKKLNNYFQQLINTIPPKIYFNKNEEILQKLESKKKRIHESSDLSAKSKNKRIKLDPNCQQTVSEIAEEFCQQKKESGKMNKLRKKLAKRIQEMRETRTSTKSPKQSQNIDLTNTEQNDSPNVPKIFNNNGELVFSKFDLTNQVDLAVEKEKTKKEIQKKKPTLKKLLNKTKREEEKIIRIQETNKEAADKMKKKKLWKNALDKSEGNKIRDDPKLIQKSLKMKNKMKNKNRKSWAERIENVNRQKQFKQEKRNTNLERRKNKKKEKKLKRLKKKNHILD